MLYTEFKGNMHVTIIVHTQQVHYPSDLAQVGPMFFLTRHKCAIFGVCSQPFRVGTQWLDSMRIFMGPNLNIRMSCPNILNPDITLP